MAVVKRSKLQPSKPVRNRPTKLRQWSDKSMVKALDMVTSGKMVVNRAALEFGVPRTYGKRSVSKLCNSPRDKQSLSRDKESLRRDKTNLIPG